LDEGSDLFDGVAAAGGKRMRSQPTSESNVFNQPKQLVAAGVSSSELWKFGLRFGGGSVSNSVLIIPTPSGLTLRPFRFLIAVPFPAGLRFPACLHACLPAFIVSLDVSIYMVRWGFFSPCSLSSELWAQR
jgi:hypothetical protein